MTSLTVISVSFNNLFGLSCTSASFFEQTFVKSRASANIVFVDGASSDGTIEFLSERKMKNLSWISEPDKGIYDAMNKGITLATGDWIIFMNAGDTFWDQQVLSEVMPILDALPPEVNLVYGDYALDGQLVKQQLSLPFLVSHMLNHQSIFYRRELLSGGYDLSYRYCADYAHLIANLARINSHKLDFPIARYDGSGVSSKPENTYKLWLERLRAVWIAPIPLHWKLLLSSRGAFMLPLQYCRALLIRWRKHG